MRQTSDGTGRDEVKAPCYCVGIDLGTSNTVAAYAERRSVGAPVISSFAVTQLVGPGELAERPALPSIRYHPLEGEVPAADLCLPWTTASEATGAPPAIIGEWARKLGSRTRGRLVTSAKSWLCHGSVDRTAAILPWGASDDIEKVSPVAASASYLEHVRTAWNHRFSDAPLENQDIVVTVPASFDDVARTLTLEAARLAGLERVRLLEEPQAACYDWLWQHRAELAPRLAGVRVILVCDIGGGTTDFSLIQVEPGTSEPRLTRIGVGDHLMLGGDNIDLALAHRLEAQLVGDSGRLSAAEFSQLIEQCREAKERLLDPDGPTEVMVTLLGSGSRLVGGARSQSLSRDEVVAVVMEGFFPMVSLESPPDRRRSGVVEFGLPYVQDPAISRHLAAFLMKHRAVLARHLGPGASPVPDAILLNGGAFRSPILAERVRDLLGHWRGEPLLSLSNERPHESVAWGAVAYALARAELGVQRIQAGSARTYFLMVDSEAQGHSSKRGVCLLPVGSPEGEQIVLDDRRFALRVGQPVRFNLWSTTSDEAFRPGDLVDLDEEHFIELPPLAVVFDAEHGAPAGERVVRLVVAMSEVGTLDLRCVDDSDETRTWSVQFLLRSVAHAKGDAPEALANHTRLGEAAELIHRLFGKQRNNAEKLVPKVLRASLERVLGPRESWDTVLCRAVFNAVLDGIPHRRRSAEHERTWLNLAGFCLRPGFGHPLDEWRIAQLWPIYGQGLQFIHESQNWAEWWTLWRRVAGGLSEDAQLVVFSDIRGFIDPASAKQGNRVAMAKKRSYEDMVRLSASLERLGASSKAELGEWLLERLQRVSEPDDSWWALGRVGARVPFHGSVHCVVRKDVAERWIGQLLDQDWKRKPAVGFAAMLIARMSGDRDRDIDPPLRDAVAQRLRTSRAPEVWISLVSRSEQLSPAEERRVFGEALPTGLALIP